MNNTVFDETDSAAMANIGYSISILISITSVVIVILALLIFRTINKKPNEPDPRQEALIVSIIIVVFAGIAQVVVFLTAYALHPFGESWTSIVALALCTGTTVFLVLVLFSGVAKLSEIREKQKSLTAPKSV